VTKQKLLDVYFTEEVPDYVTRLWETDFHTVKVKSDAFEKFQEQLEKKDRKGNPKHTAEGKHLAKCFWLQKQAKPKVPKMSGEEWERSMRALLKKLLNESWDRTPPDKEVDVGKATADLNEKATAAAEATA